MRNARLQPLTVGQPYAQANGGELQDPWSVPIARQAAGVPPTLSAKPLADSNFILANSGDAGVQPARQQGPLPQNKQTQQQIPASPPYTGPAVTPRALRIDEKPGMEMTEAERRAEQELSQFIEEYRRAAADLTQELARALTRFGTRFYEDTILKAGSDLARLAERFANEPGETAESLAASFPQTRVEGEFLAGLAAVFATLAANAERGLAFERAVRNALNAAKNTTKISVESLGRSVPDILRKGVTEIKSGLEIDNSLQLRIQATYAKSTGVPFNLVVSPTTQRVSQRVKNQVSLTGGTIQRFDPATGTFTPFQ
jgi:Restriction endonuclease fold toxin 7